MTMTRAARAALVEAFPELDQCDANHQALLYRHAVAAVQSGVPLTAPTALLQAGLPYLRQSTLPGAREAAQRLQPPSTSAGGGPASMLLTSGARARDGKGNPLAVLFPRDAHGQSPLLLGGESWLAQDRGQYIADLSSQCVLLVLAHALEVEPADLHARGVVEAEALLQALGPLHDSLSLEELGARQCAHDFLHLIDHDFFLTRYFFRNAVAPLRLVIISVGSSEGFVRVQVIQDAQWNGRADGAETRFFMTARGHAESLRPPTRYLPADVEPGGAVPLEGADAVLRHLAQHFLVEVFTHLTAGDLEHLPRTIPSSLLSACPCCAARLVLGNSQRAG